MKLDPRILVPAGLAAAAIAIPAGSSANPPQTFSCPDDFMFPFPAVGPAANKDHNGDNIVCFKTTNGLNIVFKDDNCNPNCTQNDVLPLPLPSDNPDDYADNVINP